MATLSFKKINKIYPNNVQAVFDFNLEIKDKEFIVFVGPSGCGKSTTLRMIAGLEDITSGQLFIDGILVNNVAPKDRNIAMVFQSYALYPHMTVYNNMAFGLKLRKIKFPVYEENAEVNALREKNKALLREVNKLNRVIKKKNEPAEALENRDKIYNEIFANEEKAKALLVQKVGINEVEIKDAELLIKSIEKEIKLNNVNLENCRKDLEKYNAKLSSEDNDEKRKELEDLLKSLNDIESLLKEGEAQKALQLEEAKKSLEYYQNNQVPLTIYRKHNKYEIDLEVYKTARILDLSRYLFRKPAALSGGQRQRVALGRAIVRHPKVFLMDEPLSNLDAKLRVQMRSEISKIHESVGATTVYVTHDQTEAMTMADRIVVMKDGYIQQIGTPKEVYSNPENIFVGGFIGSPAMNFIKGVVNKDKFVIKSTNEEEKDVSIKLGKEDVNRLKDYQDKEVVLGVRPEAIYLKDDINNTKPTNHISLVCDFAELLGYELVIYTYVNGQKLIFKTSIANEIKNRDKIQVCFNEDNLYFFDAETTKRIR